MITKSGHELSMTIAFRVPWTIYEEAGRIAEELAGENLSEAHRMIYRRGLEALREEEAAMGGRPKSGGSPAGSSARSGGELAPAGVVEWEAGPNRGPGAT